MMFGLSIGLAVAFAIYINDRTPGVPVRPVAEQGSNVDDNSEQAGGQPEAPPEARYHHPDCRVGPGQYTTGGDTQYGLTRGDRQSERASSVTMRTL